MNIVGEIVRTLRLVVQGLAEYVAAEKERQFAARRAAAEEAARQSEARASADAAAREAAARFEAGAAEEPEAKARATSERLVASARRRENLGRRRSRRGEGPRASVPIDQQKPILIEASARTLAEPPPPLPLALSALIARFQDLHRGLQGVLTATPALQAWYRGMMSDGRRAAPLQSVLLALTFIIERRIHRLFHWLRLQRKIHDSRVESERAERLFAGGWREAVRYLLWVESRPQLAAA